MENKNMKANIEEAAERYWYEHRVNFSGINAGEYLDKEDFLKFANQYFESQQPTIADGWISLSDYLPDDGLDVLCICKDYRVPLMANYNNEMFEVKKYPCPSDRVLIAYWTDVTHWQPLPAPPNKKETNIQEQPERKAYNSVKEMFNDIANGRDDEPENQSQEQPK